MNSFIIDLVSNASTDIYPSNSLSSFTNFLPDQINLEGDWEVALLEASHPTLYYNISDGRFRYKQNENDNDMTLLQIPAGMYHSLNDILGAMRQSARASSSMKEIDFKWRINSISQRVEISLPNAGAGLDVKSPDLAHILGFPMSVLLLGKGPHISQYPIDIVRIHSLMIYTDIIEHGIVGNTKVPLLRSFPFLTKMRNEGIATHQFCKS